MKWEVVIGLETHVQLSTNTKIFSAASIESGAEPNAQACVVDLALPGVLPVLNYGAVERAMKFGLAIGATVAERSISIRTCPRVIKLVNLNCRWSKAVNCPSWSRRRRAIRI